MIIVNLIQLILTNWIFILVPLFHIFGMVYGSIMMSRLGLPIALSSYKYNVKHVVDCINQQECTHAMIVPTMTIDILSYIEKTNVQLPSLKSRSIFKRIIRIKINTLFHFHQSNNHWFSTDSCWNST